MTNQISRLRRGGHQKDRLPLARCESANCEASSRFPTKLYRFAYGVERAHRIDSTCDYRYRKAKYNDNGFFRKQALRPADSRNWTYIVIRAHCFP